MSIKKQPTTNNKPPASAEPLKWKGPVQGNFASHRGGLFKLIGKNGLLRNQLEKLKLVPNVIPYTAMNLNSQRFESEK